MSSIVTQNTENQGFIHRFAELAWLDQVISFTFRLLAKLAEPFLAFGLIASAIDYGSHGQFLGEHRDLMNIWMITQGLALEGSGGIALSMSFDAQAQRDSAKAWMQRALALALLLVGGVMFFVELIASAKGFKESAMPDWYIYGMAGLRALVSLGYIAMCRTKHHRFSGEEPAQPQITVQSVEDEVAHQVEEQICEVRTDLETMFAGLRNAVEGQIKELPSQIKAAAQTLDYEVDPAALSAQVAQTVDQALRTIDLTAQIEVCVAHVVDQALRTAQPQKNTDELAQPTAQGKETAKIPTVGDEPARLRIQRYIEEQRAQRRTPPTLEQIMEHCAVAKNTAVKYRREFVEAQ